jgi:hypothetical protein
VGSEPAFEAPAAALPEGASRLADQGRGNHSNPPAGDGSQPLPVKKAVKKGIKRTVQDSIQDSPDRFDSPDPVAAPLQATSFFGLALDFTSTPGQRNESREYSSVPNRGQIEPEASFQSTRG